MSEIVIAAAVRTPIGSFNGSLSTVPAHYLGQTLTVLMTGDEARRRGVQPLARIVGAQVTLCGRRT